VLPFLLDLHHYLATIIDNHNIQSSTKTLSVKPDSDQVKLAKLIESHVSTSERITTGDESSPSSAGISEVNINSIKINDLPTSIGVKELMENPFTQALSATQIDEIANIFGLPSPKFSIELKRQFLDCSGIELLRQSVKEGGILHMPKHFQTCKNMTF